MNMHIRAIFGCVAALVKAIVYVLMLRPAVLADSSRDLAREVQHQELSVGLCSAVGIHALPTLKGRRMGPISSVS